MFGKKKKNPAVSFTEEQKQQAIYDIFKRENKYELIEDYVLQDGSKHPFALICPGGGYSSVCSFTEGIPYAEELNKNGFSAFILYYHVKKEGRYPVPQQDVAIALQYIFSKADDWNLDKDNYSLWGSSAGGHLVASFCTEATGYKCYGIPKPAALILCYPVVTMGKLTHKGSRKNLLGKNADDQIVKLLSVEKQITGCFPPTFLWCGDMDRTVDPENSKSLAEALEKAQIPCEFHIYQGVNHGASLAKGTSAEGWFNLAIKFWEKYM
ncbi:MAG: alpha/beta hydrolase [Oliverpabstia sp.]